MTADYKPKTVEEVARKIVWAETQARAMMEVMGIPAPKTDPTRSLDEGALAVCTNYLALLVACRTVLADIPAPEAAVLTVALNAAVKPL